VSLDRFELLELRREGSVQTYHAREISTARPVQVHLFIGGSGGENARLLELIPQLPESERRRILDRGDSQGFPYIVTDRLAGYVDFREWVTSNSNPSGMSASGRTPARTSTRTPTIDEQFFSLFDSAPPSFSAPGAAAAPAPAFAPMPEFVASQPVSQQPVVIPGPAYRPVEDPSLFGASIEIEAVRPRRGFFPTAAKSLLWLVLGVFAALAFLAALAAFFAFRH
jgi:hypothetical protein